MTDVVHKPWGFCPPGSIRVSAASDHRRTPPEASENWLRGIAAP